MRLLLSAFVSAVLLAPAALAQLIAHVIPPGPTDETPITIGVITSCPNPQSVRVEKRISEVLLIIGVQGSCPSPPIPMIRYVPIGTLAAGSYRIAYLFEGGDDIIRQAGMIHVRNARSPAPFDIHPFAVRTNPSGLRIRLSLNGQSGLALCATPDCSDITIRVGGVAAQNVRQTSQGDVWFDPPPHAAGLVDVVVEKRQPMVTWTYPAALFYVDSPDLAAFERILFPVLFNAPGANGSVWRTEAAISNPNPWFVENFNKINTGVVCIGFPCGERLSPGLYLQLFGAMHPQGVALLVPRPEADGLAFASRVRDLSRQGESFGTEVPVVREKDLVINRPITLLEVPLDPRFRVKVRIYAFESPLENGGATVRVFDPQLRTLKATHHLTLARTCAGPECVSTPFYGELDLAPGEADERVALYVHTPAEAPSWAFATVTNNTTQQVTAVTPAGGSGEPCNPCPVP